MDGELNASRVLEAANRETAVNQIRIGGRTNNDSAARILRLDTEVGLVAAGFDVILVFP